jgi:hypothetical protein
MYFDTKNYLKSTHNYTTTLRKTRFYLFEMANVKSLALFYIYQSKEKKKEGNTNRSDFPCNAQYTSHRNLHRN